MNKTFDSSSNESSYNDVVSQIFRETQNYIDEEQLISDLNTLSVEKILNELNYIGSNYDPFMMNGDEKSEKLIKKYKLYKYADDPFVFTNKLLKMSTDAQEEFQKRQ